MKLAYVRPGKPSFLVRVNQVENLRMLAFTDISISHLFAAARTLPQDAREDFS
jgi:hypothetical protein